MVVKQALLLTVRAYEISKHTSNALAARRYQCLASWREGPLHFDYVNNFSDNSNDCFVSRYYGQRLYVAFTGAQCRRDVDFLRMQREHANVVVVEATGAETFY